MKAFGKTYAFEHSLPSFFSGAQAPLQGCLFTVYQRTPHTLKLVTVKLDRSRNNRAEHVHSKSPPNLCPSTPAQHLNITITADESDTFALKTPSRPTHVISSFMTLPSSTGFLSCSS